MIDIIKDVPEQFKGQPNISAILSAFSKQLNELELVFEELKLRLNVDVVTKAQLDKLGDIVGLTRAEATALVGKTDDDSYRKAIKYKAYKNANSATYSDVINVLAQVDNLQSVSITENENLPASISVMAIDETGESVTEFSAPILAAAGVQKRQALEIKSVLQITHALQMLEFESPLCGTILCGTYPREA